MATSGASLTHRYAALDSLRGLCACLVALFHFKATGFIASLPIVAHGWMFVDFFFVLSGFIIASAYLKRLSDGFSAWRFVGLRLGRLYPLHLFVLLLYLGMELLVESPIGGLVAQREAFGQGRSMAEFLATATLANAFGLFDTLSWNGPSWSIGAEFWTYCVFAAVVLTARKAALPIFAILGVGAAAWMFAGSENWLNATYDLGFVRCLYGFSLGALLYAVVDRRLISIPQRWATAIEWAFMVACIAFVSLVANGPATMAGPLLFAVGVVIFAAEKGAVSAFLKRRAFIFVGTLSYSIYMLHAFLQGRFIDGLQLLQRASGVSYVTGGGGAEGGPRIIAPAYLSDLLTLLMLAFLIGASWWTYRFIELPSRQWVRRRLAPRTDDRGDAEWSGRSKLR